ncbi:TonB-dependent receptor domain-containing protein [Roseateles oligotrophus]|uniref:TonB-dependent receptor domain-containing protein n=1 Tax=Roseateles oligotrophus TaxID=1769250 RepID=UPI0021E38389|nr:TonB-dependent receptor [Roseateles oligotrophus]
MRAGSTAGPKSIIEADAQSSRDKAFGTHASLAPGPLNAGYDALDVHLDLSRPQWRLRAGYKLRDDMGTGAGIAQSLDPVGRGRSERINTDLGWSAAPLGRDWSLSANAALLFYKQQIPVNLLLSPPGTHFPTGLLPDGMVGHPDTSERQLRLSAVASYSGWRGHVLRLGVGHDDLNLYHTATFKNYIANAAGVPVLQGPVADYSASSPFMLPQRRKVDYLYLQDEWQLAPEWSLTAGLRHDRIGAVSALPASRAWPWSGR